MIQSIFDDDLYSFTQQFAILDNFPGLDVEYRFVDRRPSGKFNDIFMKAFQQELERMATLRVNDEEIRWLARTCPFLGPDYLAYLHNYRYDPNEVHAEICDGNLSVGIKGKWERTILWEVPLLAIISELYFKLIETNWSMDGQYSLAAEKADALSQSNCVWSDFGTRRRRSSATQEIVIKQMLGKPGFNGTSNVHYARLFDVKPIGTMSHQWIMGVSAIDGLRRANREALRRWNRTYRGNLGIALTDTFGTKAFFEDFDGELARLYDGVRHDSADPFVFGDSVIEHYHKVRINPAYKIIVFSDSLDVSKVLAIRKYFAGRINVAFGIGTYLTNDFAGSDALNIVIKLLKCNGIPVVKLSDVLTKAMGDKDALRVARWTFMNQPLD
jgi:nicotinate phosphoribosyltransferase